MKKLVFFLFILLIVVGFCFATGTTEANKIVKPIELVYTMTAVPTDAHAGAMRVFKEVVEDLSKGTIKVLTYDSASLFKQDQEVAAIKSGQADITATAASWLTDKSPWVSMFTAAYMFSSYDQLRAFYDSDIAKEVFERIAVEQGVRPLGAEYLGTRQLSLVMDKEIKTPDDLKGVKLRMPASESWMFMGRALGANPTPISFSELYMALQSKTVDGQDNPLPTTKNAKFYEVCKSITITNHVIDNLWVTINEARWQSFTDEQKGWIMAGINAGIEYCDKNNIKAEGELIEYFKSQGLKIYYADLNAFSSHVLDQYLNSDYSKTWDRDLFDRVQAAIN